MARVRCHFDGKVFVPAEPVDAPAGTPAEAAFTELSDERPGTNSEARGTMRDLLTADATGWLDALRDRDTLEFAAEIRRRGNQSSYHKQRAFIDLHEYWDSVGSKKSGTADDREGSS
jgi:hypothetical protein